jgi:hypothetical protein
MLVRRVAKKVPPPALFFGCDTEGPNGTQHRIFILILLAGVALVQGAAICAFLAGRRR